MCMGVCMWVCMWMYTYISGIKGTSLLIMLPLNNTSNSLHNSSAYFSHINIGTCNIFIQWHNSVNNKKYRRENSALHYTITYIIWCTWLPSRPPLINLLVKLAQIGFWIINVLFRIVTHDYKSVQRKKFKCLLSCLDYNQEGDTVFS